MGPWLECEIVQDVPTICIIDDDENVREGLDNFLRSVGMQVRTFASAEAFTAYAGRIDCLITDLRMPGTDGLALQARLCEHRCSFPIIIMTAFATASARNRCLELGAAAFLNKPLDPEDLLASIEGAINSRGKAASGA